MLAPFNGDPAIFYQIAPPDASSGWETDQYPRIDFSIDMQADPSRNAAGMLYINVWCELLDSPVEPADIEKLVRQSLHRAIAKEEGEPACIVIWERSENFDAKRQDEQGKDLCGYTLVFRIIAMPALITTDPCPIAGLNAFTKKMFPDAVIIGSDNFTGWLDDDVAAFYWDVQQLTFQRRTNVCVWYGIVAGCRIFCKDDADRANIASVLAEHLGVSDHVTLDDKSPLFTLACQVNPASPDAVAGSIIYTGRYGVLVYNHMKKYHPDEVPDYDSMDHIGYDSDIHSATP